MKKIVSLVIILVFAGVAYLSFRFYQENLRGVWPVIKRPPQDITEIASPNTTGFPLWIPEGFSLSIFAKELGGPRVLLLDRNGTLLTSIPGKGMILALKDKNNDSVAEEKIIVAEKLNRPHGLALRCEAECHLYIAESSQVSVWDYNEKTSRAANKKAIFTLPDDGGHVTRTLLFHPDGRLLISVGSSCNVCHETDWRRGKILVSKSDGSGLSIFAEGLRNAVFLALHPVTKKIWATEMGRDLLGDDLPPDEINIIEEGKFYGWPICYGKNIHDVDFDKKIYVRNPCMEPFEVPSLIDIPAHSAPLGLAFFSKTGWPEEYQNDLLVAYHGSWNRSVPTGYKIVRVMVDENGNIQGVEDFITGWLAQDGALGRPVDIIILPNRKIFISDDKAGVIYLLHYQD